LVHITNRAKKPEGIKDRIGKVMDMTKKKEEPLFQSGKKTDSLKKGMYGLDPETSLLSVSFATTENSYLNEHYQQESQDSNSE
jgi:hypothetical protein